MACPLRVRSALSPASDRMSRDEIRPASSEPDRPGASAVTVVVPVYRNAGTLRELHRRLVDALAELEPRELVFVDDGCDAGSGDVLRELAEIDESVAIVRLAANRGQQAAVLAGLARSRGGSTVVLDADLQDPPEAVPLLLAALSPEVDAVFGGRRGRYESPARQLTGWVYRRLLRVVAGTPEDAGAFVALSRRMVERLLELHALMPDRPPALVAMIGCSGLQTTALPVERQPRPVGRSAYSGAARARNGLGGLRWAVAWRLRERSSTARAATHEAVELHNAAQRRYFERALKPTMVPRDTPYLNRHVDELLASAEIGAGDRVLEIGCGMGRYTLLLAERGVRVEGLDLSSVLLERLASFDEQRHRIPLHCADVLDPPAELLGGFDAVVGLFALHHLHDIPASLRSVARLLRPGGRVAFCEPNPLNPLYYVQIAVRPGMTWSGDRGIVNVRRLPVARALAAAGFGDLYWRRFGFFPPFLANSALGVLERPLEGFPLWRSALPFQLFGGRLLDD